MSKRPKTANSFMSRLRRPAGRLRDLPIWSKLGLIMIVPTLATIVVGTNGLIDHIESADNADRARDLAVLTEASGELVHQLQNERAAVGTWLRSPALSAVDNSPTIGRITELLARSTVYGVLPWSIVTSQLGDAPKITIPSWSPAWIRTSL